MAEAPRDQNHVTATLFESSTSPGTTYPGQIIVATGRVKTTGTGGGSGTVTSIASGTGILLTPNPITTTGTVALIASLQPIATLGSALQSIRVNSGATALEYYTPTAGTVTSVSGTANRITSTGGATPVIDISASYVGQTSITTLGTITTGVWTGTTIAVANGGTGQTSYTDGQLLIGNTTGNTLAKATLTQGTGITITNGSGTITIAATGVAGSIVVGTTTITSGTTTRILYDNAGVLGEYTLTGSGTVVAMQTAPSFLTSITTPSVLASSNGSGSIGASGTAFSNLFLASGAVINFNAGNVTLTQSANNLTLAGGSLTVAANNSIFMGSVGSPTSGLLQIQHSNTASDPGLYVSNQNNNASVMAALLEGDRASMADNDEAYLTMRLSDDGGTQVEFARMTWIATDVNVGTNLDGALAFSVITAGTLAKEVILDGTSFSPAVDGGNSLGTTALGWQNLFGNTGFVINIENSDWVATHTTGILTVGTGDLRVTTAGTNTASVVTVGGTQTLTAKTLTSPTIQTSPVLAAATNLKFTVPSSDTTGTGITTNEFNSGYSSTAIGELVYLDSSATWQKADADASAATYSSMLGIALSVAASGAAVTVLLQGFVYAASQFPTFTIGAPVYMSATAAAVTNTAPTTTDSATRIIGYGVHADKMWFSPSNDWITHT